MRTVRYSLVDVFTRRPLTGNPLAVFTGAAGLSDSTLQAIAREMNLSETVFIFPRERVGQARLRIFTPTTELSFAGHPVLGAAGVIGRSVQTNPVELETKAGLISVEVEREGAEVRSGQMRVPIPEVTDVADSAPILEALGIDRPALPIEHYALGPGHVVLAVEGEEAVRGLRPNFSRLAEVHSGGVAVVTRSGDGIEARVFAPGAGVNEDPATGSAAGPIALHACRHGWFEFGRTIEIAQGETMGRPSRLFATAEGGPEACQGLVVGGSLVLVGRGELRLPR